MNERVVIRDKIREYLFQSTIADDRVYAQRRVNLAQENWALTTENQPLPMLMVTTRHETPEVFTDTPRVYKNELEVLVDGVLQRTTESDIEPKDQILHFLEQVECILLPRLHLPDCEKVQIHPGEARKGEIDIAESAETRKPLSAFSLQLFIPWFQEVSEEELANVGSFRHLGVEWDLANRDALIDAEDDFSPSGL